MSFIFSRNFYHLRNCLLISANSRLLGIHSNRCIVFPLRTFSDVTHRLPQTITPRIINLQFNISLASKEPKISYQYSDPIQLYQEQKEGDTIDQTATILVLDLGTTGLNSKTDKITEIAIRDVQGGIDSKFYTLVNPEVTLRNHKRNELHTESGVPRMEEAIPRLLKWVDSRQRNGKPVILVAHNGHCFDFLFLVRAFHEYGYQIPENWLFLDSLHLARQVLHDNGTKLKRGNHKLKDLVKFFNIVVEASAQKAMVDVNALCAVLQQMTFVSKLTSGDLVERAYTASRYSTRRSSE
ncbi:DNA polymerase III polC-type [Rhynchospora pubera]|uniref:DNA polymerase III polC-type n=1 Tax=Rhynchospora pubera TaxID=906938 RepID=A0AAV8D6G0_9POAL|nr:DNA polymerase III polC-type [Rhynchospora pubera]KAJ4817183.1 DNA polymerase III polC-type [Rhynchospora pubera]